MLNRSIAWALAGAMLACAALAQTLRPMAAPDPTFNLEHLIPENFGDWRVDPSLVPVAPSPDVQANLNQLYDQILTRTYVSARGERMMLVLAYGGDQSDSLKAHRQEVCYAAQGFAIRAVRNDSLQLTETSSDGRIPLVRVHAVKGRRSEPITYWFTMGDRVAIGRADRLITQIGYGLKGQIPDGLLIRVSNLSADTGTSYAAHDDFLRALLHVMEPTARRRLAGLASKAG